jgi:TPR repeat protein
LKHFGFVYRTKKRQYDKALAWYILAAMENNSTAYNSIGLLYYNGYGVPQNYLCALKWYLKAAEQREYETNPTDIGKLFEYGYDVPLDKYKALEWCRHGGDFSHLERLNNQGYDLSAADKSKSNSTIDSLY